MRATVEDDRIILHDLREVNIVVDFFLGSAEELLNNSKCITYSICWKSVNVRVEQVTFTEQIAELDFFFSSNQLVIDDQRISGDVVDFKTGIGDSGNLIAFCKIAIGIN